MQLIYTNDELVQGSALWHEFRIKGIGGSEASSLMGIGFSTVNELWAIKTGRTSGHIEMNDAMRRGHELEPIARAKYESTYASGPMNPICIIHPEHPFLRASLDGISEDKMLLVELKCPGINTHTKAVRGKVPDYYIPQLQQQLLISKALFGTEKAHYYSYFPIDPLFALNSDRDGVMIEVPHDEEYQAELVRRAKIFWDCVETDTPPNPQDFKPFSTDSVVERNDETWIRYAERYTALNKQIKTLGLELDSVTESLKQMSENVQADRVVGGGVEISKVTRVGSVDYTAIPQMAGVNVEDYRKPASSYLKIKILGDTTDA